MSVLGLVLFLVLSGVLIQYVDMDARLKNLLCGVVVVVVIVWLLALFGVLPYHHAVLTR